MSFYESVRGEDQPEMRPFKCVICDHDQMVKVPEYDNEHFNCKNCGAEFMNSMLPPDEYPMDLDEAEAKEKEGRQ